MSRILPRSCTWSGYFAGGGFFTRAIELSPGLLQAQLSWAVVWRAGGATTLSRRGAGYAAKQLNMGTVRKAVATVGRAEPLRRCAGGERRTAGARQTAAAATATRCIYGDPSEHFAIRRAGSDDRGTVQHLADGESDSRAIAARAAWSIEQFPGLRRPNAR